MSPRDLRHAEQEHDGIEKKLALVLTGGGARAAYQAGALRAIAEMGPYRQSPFQVVTGISAGAINCVFVAAHTHDFGLATKTLWYFWEHLRFEDVIDTSALSFLQIGTRLVRELALGGRFGAGRSNYLLDSTPLRKFLTGKVNFSAIRSHLASGKLSGVAVSLTDYFDGNTVTFFDAAPSFPSKIQGFHLAIRQPLCLDHVLGSSAIPIFLAPVRVGDKFYGDGGIRFTTPLSPAIHLGADAILAIGVRHKRTPEENLASHHAIHPTRISLADISGVLLNSIFLDALDSDVERAERINRLLRLLPGQEDGERPEGLRLIPVRAVKPSQDLGSLAIKRFDHFPRLLRHILRGLGASRRKGWDLLSYLAFEAPYTRSLLRLGYEDAMAQKESLLPFLQNGL